MHHARRASFAAVIVLNPAVVLADQSNVAILHGPELLKQCSRQSPLPADSYWTPSASDIDRLEALTPAAVADAFRSRSLDASKVLTGWARQYVGIIRGGKRYLYGSFFPANNVPDFKEWPARALIICDGGPAIFGIELSLHDGTISHLAFNGR